MNVILAVIIIQDQVWNVTIWSRREKEAPTTRTRGGDPFAELSPMHMCNLSDSLAIPLNLKKNQNDLVGTKLQLRCTVVKAEERRPVLQV